MTLIRFFISFLVCIFCLSLSSCALLKTKRIETPEVEITPEVKIHLPAPNALKLNKNITQIVSASYIINGKAQNYTSEVVVQTNHNCIIMVAASGWGGSIFSINYNGQTIESSSLPMPYASMGIKHTLSDFIFTYGDKKALEQAFENTPITMIIKPKMRQFFLNGQLMMLIHYQYLDPWQGYVTLKNLLYHYTIRIENMPDAPESK